MKPHEKTKVILFFTHGNTETDGKGAARTAKETLLADGRLASMAGTRGGLVAVHSTEFQKGSEVTQGLLTADRRQEDQCKGCPAAARPPGPVLPPGS